MAQAAPNAGTLGSQKQPRGGNSQPGGCRARSPMALGSSPGRSRRRVGDGERPRGSPRGARGRLRQDHPDASAEIFPLVRSLLGQREGHGHGTPACGVRGCSCSHRDGETPKLGWGWAAGSRDKGDARPRQPHGGAVISAQPVIKAGALPGGKAGEEAAQVGGTGGCWPYSLPPQFAPPPFTAAPLALSTHPNRAGTGTRSDFPP